METHAGLEQLVAQVHESFGQLLGREAEVVAIAPGRVNLIGEHVDYNGGLVLPLAIDRWVVTAGTQVRGEDASGSVICPDMEGRNTIDWPRGNRNVIATDAPMWARFVAGAIEVFPGDVPAMDVVIHGNVPLGAGVSSSAALCVSLLTLFEGVTGRRLEKMEKAQLAQRVEHEYLNVPCGLMDQMASVLGQRDHALCIDCRDHSIRPVHLPRADRLAILIVNTGVSHELASSEYGTRRKECEQALAAINRELELSLPHLGDVTFEMLEACEQVIEEVLWRRAAHVVTEIERTKWAVTALEASDLSALGKLLYASHKSLRDEFEVSCDELDLIVEAARHEQGVYGARMTGGGFGGCAIVLCEPGCVDDVTTGVCAGLEDVYSRKPEVWAVRAVDGASRVE